MLVCGIWKLVNAGHVLIDALRSFVAARLLTGDAVNEIASAANKLVCGLCKLV